MNSELPLKLNKILSDADTVAKLASVANSLTDKRISAEPDINSAETIEQKSSVYNQTGTDPRLKLLESLKPFVREEKKYLIDNLSVAVRALSLIKDTRK